jgi:UDP-glucose 4-epimerase
MKTILVTGGAGFVGTALCKRLVSDGHKVISLDNYFTGSKDNHQVGVDYREGHTKDITRLIPEQIDLIYHLGEYSRVEQSLQEPSIVWDLNVAGTFGVLEFWRERKCKLVYAGSSTKFGDGGLARMATPYAWTKAANTELVMNYGKWYELPYAITYFYNVYGPGERIGKYGTVIAIFMDKFAKGEPLQVTSPGTQKRNFTHISDIVDGLILVGEKGESDEFGLGNEKSYSMLDVAHLFGGSIEMLPERPGNRLSSDLDTTKSRALGWEPKVSLETEIAKFVTSNSKI